MWNSNARLCSRQLGGGVYTIANGGAGFGGGGGGSRKPEKMESPNGAGCSPREAASVASA